jgi:hypothetical protein
MISAKSACIPWWGAVEPSGYGYALVRGRKIRAHRLIYEECIGPLGQSHVHHRCGSKACVNPEHLEALSNSDHRKRHPEIFARARAIADRAKRAKTHCTHGHVFDGQNTYIRRDGSRDCRACASRRAAANYRKRRQEAA